MDSNKLAEIFEKKHGLTRYDKILFDGPKDANGAEFEELLLRDQPTEAECAKNFMIVLDSFVHSKRAFHPGSSGKIVFWRMFPEITEIESTPGVWRGYARLSLGVWPDELG